MYNCPYLGCHSVCGGTWGNVRVQAWCACSAASQFVSCFVNFLLYLLLWGLVLVALVREACTRRDILVWVEFRVDA